MDVFSEEGEWLEGPFGIGFVESSGVQSTPDSAPSPTVWKGVPVDRAILGEMVRVFVAETGKTIAAVMLVRAVLNLGLRDAKKWVDETMEGGE